VNGGPELESRLERLETALQEIDARLAKIEREPHRARRSAEPQPEVEPSGVDFALIGKSVLMIGGAYVLRALTEMGYLNELAGIVLAFLYAMVWIWIGNRATRTVALFDAGTAALIAGSLTWEATARFHAITPPVASAMIVVAAIALLWVARRRNDPAFALIGFGMTGMIGIGLAITTGDVLPPLVAVALMSILSAAEGIWPSYATLALAVVSAGMAAPLMFLPRGTHAAIVIITIVSGVMYALALRRREPLLVIAAAWSGLIASVLAIQPAFLPSLWATAALVSAVLARQRDWHAMAFHSAFCSVAAAAACIASPPSLPIVAVVSAISLLVANRARIVFLAVATATSIMAVMVFLPESSPVIRTAIIALAAVTLSLLRTVEAATLARILLVIGGLKLLFDDMRLGRATTIVIALALYGGAMVIVARRRRQPASI